MTARFVRRWWSWARLLLAERAVDRPFDREASLKIDRAVVAHEEANHGRG